MCRFLTYVVLLFAASAAGCKKPAKHSAAPPPLEVEVAVAQTDSVADRMEFIGYLQSNFNAVIQPRVSGYLTSRQFEYGMPVKKGQLLFTIDGNLLRTTLLSARASLESARARAVEARNNYERAVPLARINAISQTQLDQYTATYAASQAAVRSAEQALSNAGLEVGYTKLYAPIDGTISNTAAHVGDYVGPGTQFEVLATISNLDTMTVDLAIPMSRYLKYAAPDASIYDNDSLLGNIELRLADGKRYPIAGRYDYTRKDVSNTSGTLIVVAEFPNPENRLKPGQFARISASIGQPRPRVMVPQRCVSQAQGVDAVWVVRPDSTVEYRRVTLGDLFGGMWAIDQGVAGGEQVLMTGQQKMHTGMKVVPKKVD